MNKQEFQYTADETARLWKLKKNELYKSMRRPYIVRWFYAARWRYYSNEIVMGVYDAIIFGFLLGLLVAALFAISIVEVSKPWLTE